MSLDPLLTSVDHVGRGWAFPLQLSVGGGFRLVSDTEEIEGAIRMILGTRPGERLLRPEFGCTMWEQTFAPCTRTTAGLVEQAVRRAVERWEPRVELERVEAVPLPEEACLRVLVDYRIKATNDHRNLVHPFYVIPREEPR